MKTTFRSAMLAMAVTAFWGGSAIPHVSAQDEHTHAANHDHKAMQKEEEKITGALATLSVEDQTLAKAQRFCATMTHSRLGSMGAPVKLNIEGKPVFVCCAECTKDAVAGGPKTVKTAAKLRASTATLAKLPMEERMAVEAQKYCAVNTGSLLGSMGAPVKLDLNGKPVYLCCKGCTKKAQADPGVGERPGCLALLRQLQEEAAGESRPISWQVAVLT